MNPNESLNDNFSDVWVCNVQKILLNDNLNCFTPQEKSLHLISATNIILTSLKEH